MRNFRVREDVGDERGWKVVNATRPMKKSAEAPSALQEPAKGRSAILVEAGHGEGDGHDT